MWLELVLRLGQEAVDRFVGRKYAFYRFQELFSVLSFALFVVEGNAIMNSELLLLFCKEF